MGNHVAEGQLANEQPPVQGKVYTVTLDATSRVYDLGALLLGDAHVDRGGEMMLTLRADARWFYKFDAAAGMTVDETAANAAGAAPSFAANAAADAAANEKVRVRIDRKRHRYLAVKGAGAGVLRVWVSSDPSTR